MKSLCCRWWQQQGDASIEYLAVTALDLQACDLASFPNLKVYINPGGDAYAQLTDMGVAGRDHIISFVQRDQKTAPSAYVGFCAGGYIASHDYLWETMYEGPGYYNFEDTPPLALFPHSVEGSIVDINDDQFGDQSGSKFRLVNVSNGQQMLYYGGSTFGYSGTVDPTDPASQQYDPEVEVLVYYTDFYGFQSSNIPAAWRYRNRVMTSVHPEADNCTFAQDSDCPPAGSIPEQQILQNRAWLCQYMNEAMQMSFHIPEVALAPVFDTTPPHTHTPLAGCYSPDKDKDEDEEEGREEDDEGDEGGVLLFCDGFDAAPGAVAVGLSPQFQRNQSDYNRAQPWNTSSLSSWNQGTQYASPQGMKGGGYAIAVPQASAAHVSTIMTKAFSLAACSSRGDEGPLAVSVSFYLQGQTEANGFFGVQFQQMRAPETDTDPHSPAWEPLLLAAPLPLLTPSSSASTAWQHMVLPLSLSPSSSSSSSPLSSSSSSNSDPADKGESAGSFLRLQFACAAGVAVENYCAIDTLSVVC